MISNRLIALLGAMLFLTSLVAHAEDVTVNAEARRFNPDIVYIELGDTVSFTNMTSHNSVSYVVPQGASNWKSALGENIKVTPDKEGIYGYVCVPHIGFGMVGVIVVGESTQAMKDAAMKTAMDTLEGPFRRVIGKIKKVEVK